MISYRKRIWLILLLPLILAGCKPGGLHLNIRYDQIHGLIKGDRLIFQQNHIGKVTNITYTDKRDYTVAVIIQKDFAGAVTKYSRFYITDDPQREGHKAVEMIRVREGGAPLKDHATLEGSTKTSAFFEQIVGGFGTTFEELTDGVSQHPFAKEDHLIQTLRLERPMKSLQMGIQVRALCRQQHGVHIHALQDCSEGQRELVVAVHEHVTFALEEAIFGVGQVPQRAFALGL